VLRGYSMMLDDGEGGVQSVSWFPAILEELKARDGVKEKAN
jgi:hypothetical protein